jgi:Ca2+-binding RTX toxin-like protein
LGRDRIDAGKGSNVVHGGPGPDNLEVGSREPGTVRGGSGNDFVNARDAFGGDVVRGGDGNDTCWVDAGDDVRGCESLG